MIDRPPDKQSAAPSGLGLNDILYVLFRHKWMILAFVVAGILAAASLFFIIPTKYSSEAKLLVRYVVDSRSMASVEKDPQFKSPDTRGENVLNSEVEILTSLDLAEEVADLVGPERILAKTGVKTNALDRDSLKRIAAAVIANPKNLTVEIPKNSSIIRIYYQHPDSSVVAPVLTSLLARYIQKHRDIHRGGVGIDDLDAQITELNTKIADKELALRTLKNTNGIVSVEDSKKALNDEIMRISGAFLAAEAELAERQATLKELQPPKSEATATELGVPADTIDEYKTACERWYAARKRESENSVRYNDENPSLIALRAQVADAQKKKKEMEAKFPQLAKLNVPPPAAPAASPETRGQALDPLTEFARAKAIEAKLRVLTAQLAKVNQEAARVDEAGAKIIRLQREKDQLEDNLRFYMASRDQARVDQTLGPGRTTNLSIVQQPSPAAPALNKKNKTVLGALGGLIAAGLALAFGLELFLDPRVKRPSEIESRLHLPLFLSIPRTQGGRKRIENRGSRIENPEADPSLSGPPDAQRSTLNAQLPPDDPLTPYYSAVRDRLTMYFQSRNMTKKPKLVGVTGCAKGAGVTTLAAGLAASLSELGDGNVLLVDMAVPNGVLHPFHNGKPVTTLNSALAGAPDASSAASLGPQSSVLSHPPAATPIRQNLFLARANDPSDRTFTLVPSRFLALMPRLKASDYDYIIFDMPPVSPITSTAGLASMLDITFLVVEAEKSNRDGVKRSISTLAAANASVVGILNKTRTFLPAWLHQES